MFISINLAEVGVKPCSYLLYVHNYKVFQIYVNWFMADFSK